MLRPSNHLTAPEHPEQDRCPNCAVSLPPCRALPPFIGAGPDARGHGGVLHERSRLAMVDSENEHDRLADLPRRFDWIAQEWEPQRVGWLDGAIHPLDGVKARQIMLHVLEPRPRTYRPAPIDLDERAILERLGADLSRQSGMMRCPAHEDRAASLSWRWDGVKALLHCFAGCTFDEIRAAA